MEFLCTLERDLPQYLRCTHCAKLYLWQDQGAQHVRALLCPRRTSRDHDKPERLHLGAWIYHEERDLIVKAHLHGPDYGLPISVLSWDRPATVPAEMHSIGRAAVIGHHLVLRRIETFRLCHNKDIHVQTQVLNETHLPHDENNMIMDHALCVMHALLSRAAESDVVEQNIVTVTPLLNCSKCYYSIRVTARWSDNCIELALFSYKDFGSRDTCDNTFDLQFPTHRYWIDCLCKDARNDLEHLWTEHHKEELNSKTDLECHILSSVNDEIRQVEIVELPTKFGTGRIESWNGWALSNEARARFDTCINSPSVDTRCVPGGEQKDLLKFTQSGRPCGRKMFLSNCLPILSTGSIFHEIENWIRSWNSSVVHHTTTNRRRRRVQLY